MKKVLQNGKEKLKKVRVNFSAKNVNLNIKFLKYSSIGEESGEENDIMVRFERKQGNELTFYNMIEKLKNKLEDY